MGNSVERRVSIYRPKAVGTGAEGRTAGLARKVWTGCSLWQSRAEPRSAGRVSYQWGNRLMLSCSSGVLSPEGSGQCAVVGLLRSVCFSPLQTQSVQLWGAFIAPPPRYA